MIKRLFKRIQTFILAGCLLFSTFGTVYAVSSAELTLSDEEEGLMMALGCLTEGIAADVQVTRAQFVNMIFTASNLNEVYTEGKVVYNDVTEDNDCFAAVYVLQQMGIIKGGSGGSFNPDDFITAEQAGLIAFRVLGYNNVISEDEYEKIILKKRILPAGTSINLQTPLTYIQALKIVCNILNTDISDLNANSTSGKMLYREVMLGIYRFSGVVTADVMYTLDGLSSFKDDYFVVDGIKFKNNTGKTDLFGLDVVVYASKGDSEYEAFVVIDRTNEKTRIGCGEIVSFKDYTYTYFKDDSNKEYRLIIDKNATIIYNGDVVTVNDAFNISMLKPQIGYIYAYSNDGDSVADILYVNSFVAAIANTYDSNSNKIILKNNMPDIDLNKVDYVIKDANSETVDTSYIRENSLLWITENIAKTKVTIVVNNESIETSVISSSQDEITTVDGKTYKYADYFNAAENEPLVFNKDFTFILDPDKRIAAIMKSSVTSEMLDGILIGFSDGEKIFDEYRNLKMKIFTSDGEVQKFEFAKKKVRITDFDGNSRSVTLTDFVDLVMNKSYCGLIRFKCNTDNMVTEVEFPYESAIAPSENSNQLNMFFETSADNGDINYYGTNPYRNYSFAGNGIAHTNTVVFFVPANRSEDYNFRCGKISTLAEGSKMYKLYNFDPSSTAVDYCVIYEDANAAYAYTESTCVVEEITRIWNEKKEEAETKVVMRDPRSGSAEYVLKDESVFKNVDDQMLSGDKHDISVGDIVRASVQNDRIMECRLIFDADGTKFGGRKGYLAGAKISTHDISGLEKRGNPYSVDGSGKVEADAYQHRLGTGLRYFYGYVYSVSGDALVVTTQDLSKDVYNPEFNLLKNKDLPIENSYVTQSYRLNYMIAIDYDGFSRTGSISVKDATSSDVRPYTKYGSECSRVLFVTRYGDPRGAYLLNGKID